MNKSEIAERAAREITHYFLEPDRETRMEQHIKPISAIVERAIAESQVQAEPSILGLCRTCGETVTHGNHSPSLAGHYFVAELGDGEPSPEPEPVCPMCCKPVFTDRAEGDTRELKAVREALWQLMRCVELGYKGKPLEDAMAAAEKLLG